MSESKHLSVHIDRLPADVYGYVADPRHFPEWAPGLCSAIEQDGDRWFAVQGESRVELTFAAENPFGVLDHDVHLPDGPVVHNPLRVVPHDEGSELTFVLRRQAGMADDEFARDEAAVRADLDAIKEILERA